MIVIMNVTSANNMSNVLASVKSGQSNQDSHEKNIESKIVNLQGKIRDLAYNTEMSDGEKSDKKKKLKEQIQNLSSELKQYQINKRRDEEKKQTDESETSGRTSEKASSAESVGKAAYESSYGQADSVNSGNDSEKGYLASADGVKNVDGQLRDGESAPGLKNAEVEVMISISNTRQQFADIEKIQTNLTGLMRTAETDEEKLKLQKKIDSVTNIIEEKAGKTADKLAEIREEEKAKKKRLRKMLEEQEAKKEDMKAAVPKSGRSVFADKEYGKVLLTRRKF